MRLVRKGSFFPFEFRSFEISKESHSKERSIYAYIRTNETFLSKRISKERPTNFERTLFDQTTYPENYYQNSSLYLENVDIGQKSLKDDILSHPHSVTSFG